jgi:hypothetical protein
MTPTDAVDTMCGVFRDAWVAAGYDLANVRWDDVTGAVTDEQVTWARVTIKHFAGPTRAFGQHRALYSNTGTLYVQIFTPAGGANQEAYDASYAVVSAYRGAINSGVSFRDTRIREVGVSGAFQQTNVLTDFSYDD